MVEVGCGEFSRELCGGTHVPSTGVIGLFHITSEAGVGSGLRRIEAVTGPGAVSFFRQRDRSLEQAAGQLRCEADDVPDRVARLQQQLKEMQKQRDDLLVGRGAGQRDDSVVVDGTAVVIRRQDGLDADTLGKLADRSCSQNRAAAAVVASLKDGKVIFVSKVMPDLVRRGVHAGSLVKALATRTGGGGGGRPDFAQAGGRDADAIDAALSEVPDLISKMIAEAAG
ncbi:MAG: DHHA1 domain-containing protein [Chloroflexi bacterium]|nr:DHHA1 domain-containing protein [Chloroflexota bacterium]